MKKLLFLIFLIAFQIVQAQLPDPDFNDKAAFSEGRTYLKKASFRESENYEAFNLIYQRLKFSVDPSVRYISGSVYSLVRYLQNSSGKIQFDLSDNLTVDSVKCNGDLTTFEHSSDKLNIDLLMPMGMNTISPVEVFYHGVPPDTGFGSFTISKHGNSPILWTLSEPYGASDWWPCKQSLADKIDSMDIYITSPEQYKAASNGKLVSDVVNNGLRTAHWKHRYPIATYLVGIAVTNYETYSDYLNLPDGKMIEVLNYVYPEYLPMALSKSEEILRILNFYNSKFITYPFAAEKYGHAQFGWGGGMEHQTMSFMTDLNFELVAHEMAHQWFGDYITLASWHDIWLNEGFATYLTGLTFENNLYTTGWLLWKNYQINRITKLPGGTVYVTDTTNVYRIFDSRLSYAKGAYLLHMLRWEMGDGNFFAGMKNYLEDPTIAGGFASQEKFVKHMEAAADTTFTEFFKDWYYGEGYPIYTLNYYTDYGDYGKQKVNISQTPSVSSAGFFEMHVPIRVWKAGTYQDFRLYNTQQNQQFTISNEPIDSIQFDPDRWLITKNELISKVVNLSESKEIQIIRDPSGNIIHVLIPEFSGKNSFRIIDLAGRIMKQGLISNEDFGIDVNALKNGIYLVDVRSNSGRKIEKFNLSR